MKHPVTILSVSMLFMTFFARADMCWVGACGACNERYCIRLSYHNPWKYTWTDNQSDERQTGPLPLLTGELFLEAVISRDGSRFAVVNAAGNSLDNLLTFYTSDGVQTASLGARELLNDTEFAALTPTSDQTVCIEPGASYVAELDALKVTALSGRKILVSMSDGRVLSSATAQDDKQGRVVFHYVNRDAVLSNYNHMEVRVDEEGKVWGRYRKELSDYVEFRYALEQREMKDLQVLSRSLELLAQPLKGPISSADIGISMLLVSAEGIPRTIALANSDDLDPLIAELRCLVERGLNATGATDEHFSCDWAATMRRK